MIGAEGSSPRKHWRRNEMPVQQLIMILELEKKAGAAAHYDERGQQAKRGVYYGC